MVFPPPVRAARWTRERIDALATPDLRQLRANAERLREPEIVDLCDQALRGRPKGGPGRGVKGRSTRRLVSRSKAFELRGVWLESALWSRGGVRKSDGAVVMTLWADDVRSADGGCSYRLWAPNVDGSCPWSDSPGGQERLEHCRLALGRGEAEGLLVHGERIEGALPDDKAASVEGVDPEIVLLINVEKRAQEYWATWGKKSVALRRAA